MEALPFEIGTVSRVTAWTLGAGTTLYALASAYYTTRAFGSRHEDRWSAFGATLVMAALALLLTWQGDRLLPAPYSVLVALFYLLGIVITLTWTLGRYEEKVARFRKQFGKRLDTLLAETLPEHQYALLERIGERWREGHEGRRKLPHLLMALFLGLYAGLGYFLLRGFWFVAYGGTGSGGGEGIHNLYEGSHSSVLAGSHLLGVSLLLSLLFLIAPNEFLRLRFPELSYPFKATILDRMRKKEEGLFMAHYYIAATLPLSALWLTRDATTWDTGIPAVMAMLSVTIFADAASALFGIRYGRRKWPHNPDKSYVGSFAGTAVAFLVALPFVGAPVAVLSAGVFLLMDLLGPIPLSVSDNILNPIGLAVAYTLAAGSLDPLLPFY